jgi:hypothetical protein
MSKTLLRKAGCLLRDEFPINLGHLLLTYLLGKMQQENSCLETLLNLTKMLLIGMMIINSKEVQVICTELI